MNGTLSNLIKAKDFSKVSYTIFLRNEKTGHTLNKKKDCKLMGLEEDSVVLCVPKSFCGDGQNITLFIYKDPMKEKIKLIPTQGSLKGSYEVLAQVTNIEECEENEKSFMKDNHKNYITLKFTQYDEFKWKRMCNSFKEAQVKISQVVQMASEE